MRSGKSLQRGTPEEVYLTPNSAFVADLIGLIDDFKVKIGTADSRGYTVELANGMRIFAADRKLSWSPGNAAHLLVRPESIRLTSEPTGAENEIPATIEKVSFTGSVVNYFILVDGISESYRVQNLPPVKYKEGDRVYANFFGAECNLTKE